MSVSPRSSALVYLKEDYDQKVTDVIEISVFHLIIGEAYGVFLTEVIPTDAISIEYAHAEVK